MYIKSIYNYFMNLVYSPGYIKYKMVYQKEKVK